MAQKERLQKYLSECGVASRRKAEQLIEQGKIKIGDKIAVIGDKVDPEKDKVFYNGKAVKPTANKTYIMLYKPRGFVTTMNDEQGRKCVADLVKDVDAKVFPVGRLDKDSEGLLIMTNDGEVANYLMHPKNEIVKTYRVTVRPPIDDDAVIKLEAGVKIDGEITAPCEIETLEKDSERMVLLFKIHEGKNREIRKMCDVVGTNVIRLKRLSIGKLKLGMLQPGKWRKLTSQEVDMLVSKAGKNN